MRSTNPEQGQSNVQSIPASRRHQSSLLPESRRRRRCARRDLPLVAGRRRRSQGAQLSVLAGQCRSLSRRAVREGERRQDPHQGICRRRPDARRHQPVAARLVRRRAGRRRIHAPAARGRLRRGARSRRLSAEGLLAGVPEIPAALVRRQALRRDDRFRLSRPVLQHQGVHAEGGRLLCRHVVGQGQGQGRLLRLVPALHGLGEPVERQSPAVRYRRRQVRRHEGEAVLAEAAGLGLLHHRRHLLLAHQWPRPAGARHRRVDHARPAHERRAGRHHHSGGRRPAMDRVALHREGHAEAGSRPQVHPVHHLARGPGEDGDQGRQQEEHPLHRRLEAAQPDHAEGGRDPAHDADRAERHGRVQGQEDPVPPAAEAAGDRRLERCAGASSRASESNHEQGSCRHGCLNECACHRCPAMVLPGGGPHIGCAGGDAGNARRAGRRVAGRVLRGSPVLPRHRHLLAGQVVPAGARLRARQLVAHPVLGHLPACARPHLRRRHDDDGAGGAHRLPGGLHHRVPAAGAAARPHRRLPHRADLLQLHAAHLCLADRAEPGGHDQQRARLARHRRAAAAGRRLLAPGRPADADTADRGADPGVRACPASTAR